MGLALASGCSILELAALAFAHRWSFWRHLSEVIPLASYKNFTTQDGVKKISNSLHKQPVQTNIACMYVLSDLWLHKDFDVLILSQLQDSCLKKEAKLLSIGCPGARGVMQESRVNSACCSFWFLIAYGWNSLLPRKVLQLKKVMQLNLKAGFSGFQIL